MLPEGGARPMAVQLHLHGRLEVTDALECSEEAPEDGREAGGGGKGGGGKGGGGGGGKGGGGESKVGATGLRQACLRERVVSRASKCYVLSLLSRPLGERVWVT